MTQAAIFDFDRTLTRRDTLLPWVTHLVGPGKAVLGVAATARGAMPPWTHDRRGRAKAALFRAVLSGRREDEIEEAAKRLEPEIAWNDAPCARLLDHLRAGHKVLIATGALAPVARILLTPRFGSLEVIGTELAAPSCDGTLDGSMASANCIGTAKAERVARWIKEHGPFDRISGYGNAPHDLPMLSLCDAPHLVARGQLSRLPAGWEFRLALAGAEMLRNRAVVGEHGR